MTKIDIISGFLGAGKTTLIKKLIEEAYKGEQVVLIENEFGEIGIDGGFLQDAGVNITEMNSGCICCSLVGDFGAALHDVIETYHPDRVLIEPSGVGKLSDVIRAVERAAETTPMTLNAFIAVADAAKCKLYMKNFGEFFNNQIEHANAVVLSRTQKMNGDQLKSVVENIRTHNKEAVIVTTPWDELTGAQLLTAMEERNHDAAAFLMKEEAPHCHHDHGEDCSCGCGHDHHHDSGHDHHHGHEHDHDCRHHHDHGEECSCGCGHDHHHDHGHGHYHDHGHGHDHHADEVFISWGVETPNQYTEDEIKAALEALDSGKYGAVLRAKGIVPAAEGEWIHFDYVPEEHSIRRGRAEVTGRLCVIGAELKEERVAKLFGV